MQLLLSSPKAESALSHIYEDAVANCEELYIATAYLTAWPVQESLSSTCRRLLFLVGTDFGLTRKAACRAVIRWLPASHQSGFLAVPQTVGNFHPKIIAWRTSDNHHYCVIGSSNLSEAGLTTNTEANVHADITEGEYQQIVRWLGGIAADAEPINDAWLAAYKERPLGGKSGGKKRDPSLSEPVIPIVFPTGKRYEDAIKRRRTAQATFSEIAPQLRSAMQRCVNSQITNGDFWNSFWAIWANHSSRFQGSGLQIKGKAADWKEACASTLHILNAQNTSDDARDQLARDEIDNLARLGVPVRGAWLSEMLCHYLPDHYPLLNNPIKGWLASQKWRPQRGCSEGARYVQLAKTLRKAISTGKGGPRNMPEVDAVAWTWYHHHDKT